MRIAMIGTGNVGGTLGTGWAKHGHTVVFGSRNPGDDDTRELLGRAGANASALTPAEAAKSAQVIALAVPWPAAQAALASLGDLSGKVLLDCTNPVTNWPALDHSGGSGGEQVAGWAKGARVVKIFNTTGFDNMANPHYGAETLTMFYAGDDADAKKIGHQLAADLGFEPQDCGPLNTSSMLEVMASLWGTLAYGQGLGRGIGFRLLKR